MSIIRKNLLTVLGYTPYCGGEEKYCSYPRTKFNGTQFECPVCKWKSQFEPEFIEQYKESQQKMKEQGQTNIGVRL